LIAEIREQHRRAQPNIPASNYANPRHVVASPVSSACGILAGCLSHSWQRYAPTVCYGSIVGDRAIDWLRFSRPQSDKFDGRAASPTL
jgi:hypothetical protein